MVKDYQLILGKYFDKHSFVDSNIRSYNNFVEKGMQKIVNETSEIIPTIIPQEVENFKIKLNKIWAEKPQITEADGSKRNVYPMEARLRKLTYSAPLFLEVAAHIDNVQRESFTTEVGKLPVMLKSKYCHLYGLKREELIEHGEDPDDKGGYFILNGNERVLITVEDLAANKMFINEGSSGPSKYTAKIFSERGSYRIPHTIEQMKDEIKNQNDALEFLSKRIGLTQPKEQRDEKTYEQLDKYLLPHLGITSKERIWKAYNLCKCIKKYLMVVRDGVELPDKDHYMNKRLKLSGDLLGDLFRVNLRALVQDMIYNFQRLVKRGKFHSIKIIIREKLL